MTAPESSIFPKLVCCAKVDTQHESVATNDFYDVKFWPYLLEDGESIFAVAGTSEIFVCRTVTKGEPTFEIINWWHDTCTKVSANSIAWMKDVPTGKPLLCVAGGDLRHITMMDISNGKQVRTLTGHGRNINELIVSPTAPNILASCSEDFTIRLWNINPEFASQPCVAILAGEGHRQPLLSCAFHPNGRWILSGAMDTAVALWAVPSPEVLSRQDTKNDEPAAVTYPHFYSIEVHHNYVDSLAFYGDLIISRCAQSQNDVSKQHEILMWKIDGFNADEAPPKDIAVPRPGRESRSSFPHEPLTQGFTRLLSFSMPSTDRFTCDSGCSMWLD
ncbi:hypothetical protein AMS68_006457 [Peltaster fructicola]|uniref:Uncharacterized protein n=1 Tax=Peltaster fructicola TaxID=286661 RepID=A0A6H0Y2S5_9PEZI|nr:hypothetical protein AMS68_006457 [Peltaster fructicola]